MRIRLAATFLAACSAFAARQPFTTADLSLWHSVSDARIGPDGKNIVFVDAVGGSANLWMVGADGRDLMQWTKGAWEDRSPRWSADGARVAWISTRDGKTRIFVRDAAGGAESAVAAGDLVPLAIAWSPDGKSIAFTAAVPESHDAAWAPPSILPLLKPPRSVVQLFVANTAGGAPRQVTKGPLDCVGEPGWLIDGASIVVVRGESRVDLVRVADGSAKTLADGPGRITAAVPSGDGSKIAYLMADARPRSYAIHKVVVMNPDGSRAKVLTGGLDRDAMEPQWSSDSRTVYFLADDRGTTHVYAARNDGTVRQVTTAPERLQGFSLADNGRAVSVKWSATEAGDLATFTVDHVTQPLTLASPNEHLLAERDIGAVETVEYHAGANTIQARVVKPARFDAAAHYPLLLDIQDDPRAMCGAEFSLRHQILAAKGFLVLCANVRGTPGYGDEFGALLRTRNPGDDFDDLMAGVDFVAGKGSIDTHRLYVAGGLVAAWAVGHTDKFRAAVIRRPVVDWVTNVAVAADGSKRASDWMGAMPWDEPDQYVKRSPLFAAQNFKATALIVAAENDPEAAELEFALAARKVKYARMKDAGEAATIEATAAWLLAN